MSAPIEPSSPLDIRGVAQAAYQSVRDFILGLSEAVGMPAVARRSGESASAFSYQMLLTSTFGRQRAEELAHEPKRQAQELAPKPFDEAFGEIPDSAADKSFAVSILGFAGVALTLTAVVGAAICINVQRIESQAPPPPATRPTDTTRPDQKSGIDPATRPRDNILNDTFTPNPASRNSPDVPNQVAPNRSADPKANDQGPIDKSLQLRQLEQQQLPQDRRQQPSPSPPELNGPKRS